MKKLIIIFILFPLFGYSQYLEDKKYQINRTITPPKIDGKDDDLCWKNTQSGQYFICFDPNNGEKIDTDFKTEFKATYDNKAIYFIIKMKDPSPDSILRQLSPRDDLEKTNSDQISILINPYNDGQTDFKFSVSAAGVQEDIKLTQTNRDLNWDMVWDSKVNFDESGWSAEFKIPYSALRFPKKNVQEWGLNIIRNIRRYRKLYSWNFIDKNIENKSIQSGKLIGLVDIKPPLRLSFMPYFSANVNHFEDEIKTQYNGGMDLKYGINESYTLDMTLIPDFGQVGFDNQILNLSPYEIQYDEKRAFFNEGTELLEKGGLFYSRRISDNLINATKITGRNKENLGVGFLNAITGKNDETDKPLSNYNVFVIDQTINKNSSFTFTNTNVQRHKNQNIESNVMGIRLALQDKNSNYQFLWNVNHSQIIENCNNSNGFASFFEFAKISGKIRYKVNQKIENESYNPNELGFLNINNQIEKRAEISYRILKPTKKLVSFNTSLDVEYVELYKPRKFSELDFSFRQYATFKNYLTWGLFSKIKPINQNDYFEARSGIDRVFKKSSYYGGRTLLSSDYRKRLALDLSLNGGFHPLYNGKKIGFRISPRFRINDKLFMTYVYSTENKLNEAGYTTKFEEEPIFAIRDVKFITNVLESQYVLNNKMSAKIKVRHHWEQVKNHSFHSLNSEGILGSSNYSEDHDINFNAWNIYLTYSWWFAPGSEINLVWKNAILTQNNELTENYYDNINNLFDNPIENSLSLMLRYYLDYQYLKRK